MFSLSGKSKNQIPCFPCAVGHPVFCLLQSSIKCSASYSSCRDIFTWCIHSSWVRALLGTSPPLDRIEDRALSTGQRNPYLTFKQKSVLMLSTWKSFQNFLEDMKSFLWGQWSPCFRLLVTQALGFKFNMDPLTCRYCHLRIAGSCGANMTRTRHIDISFSNFLPFQTGHKFTFYSFWTMVFNPEFSHYKDIISAHWAAVDTSPNVTFVSTICKVELDQFMWCSSDQEQRKDTRKHSSRMRTARFGGHHRWQCQWGR